MVPIDPSRWNRLKQIVNQALDLPASRRSEYISKACGTDTDLRAEVESLLRHDAEVQDEGFLDGNPQEHQTAQSRNTIHKLAARIACPCCQSAIEIQAHGELEKVNCPQCGSKFGLINEEGETRRAESLKTLGHFELVELIGVGGFATVWKARDTNLDRTVAIKIPRKRSLSATETEQFFREARAAAQIRHPNIVGIHEVGKSDDLLYIVIDYVNGISLSDWMDNNPLDCHQAAELCEKIARLLHVAHDSGIVHRDVKPLNILMDPKGEPHITDFGLAKRDAVEITISINGQILGTPAYMSPEQANGEVDLTDHRSDIYSLGVILYELLTGDIPFRGTFMQVLMQVVGDKPKPPRQTNAKIHPEIERICMKCLEKDRNHRYQSAIDLADDLRGFQELEPVGVTSKIPFSLAPTKVDSGRLRYLVGIDLGTTHSIAAWTHCGAESLSTRDGETSIRTPSAVLFADDRICVGREAQKLGLLNPDRLAEKTKRRIGDDQFSITIETERIPSQVVQAYMLNSLIHDVSTKIGSDFGVVLTVPSMFRESARRAMLASAEIAGVDVLAMVNESLAMVLGDRAANAGTYQNQHGPMNVLVFHLGGGTFEVALFEVNGESVRTVCMDGNLSLGGINWTARLGDYACDFARFADRNHPDCRHRLETVFESAKQTLSVRKKAVVELFSTGKTSQATISRQDFEQCTADLVEKTANMTDRLLKKAGIEWSSISRLLLAGGASRMPMISNMLKRRTDISPVPVANQEELVARGGLVFANRLLHPAGQSSRPFTSVNAYQLEMSSDDVDSVVLIDPNTTLPFSKTHLVETKHPGQTELSLSAYEVLGERGERSPVGRIEVSKIPPDLNVGHPIQLTFEYNENATLNVKACVVESELELGVTIERPNELSGQEISSWRGMVQADGGWSEVRRLIEQARGRDGSAKKGVMLEQTKRVEKYDVEFRFPPSAKKPGDDMHDFRT